MWELPYSAGLGIIHAAGIRAGLEMRLVNGKRDEREEENVESMREAFAAMRERFERGGGELNRDGQDEQDGDLGK